MATATKKLIATDLDGTLFDKESKISKRTLSTLDRAHQANHTVVAVTGRSWRTAYQRLQPANCVDYIICSNGAYLYSQSQASVVWHDALDKDKLNTVLEQIKKLLPESSFGWESPSGIFYQPEYIALAQDLNLLEGSGETAQLGGEIVYKLFVRTRSMSVAEMLEALTPELNPYAYITTSGAPFLEITASNVNKGTALERLTAEVNLSAEDSIAFGDNLNDIPMLSWANTGVAMANALPEVKAIADRITGSNEEDGVADYLEKRILQV